MQPGVLGTGGEPVPAHPGHQRAPFAEHDAILEPDRRGRPVSAVKSSLTDLFIRRPVLAIVLNLVILAVGWRAVGDLPVRQYPRIESTSTRRRYGS